MRISWRERLEQMPSLQRFSNWPVIPLDTVPPDRRKQYLRNMQIVDQVLDGVMQQRVAHQHNVSPGYVTQLLNRCLGGDQHKPPALTEGLLPFKNIRERQRKQPLPTFNHPHGSATAFTLLLETVPGLHEGLDTMIEAKLKDSASAQRLTPATFHGEFKRLLAEVHWPADCYPYTSASCAYESVRRYLALRTAELLSNLCRKLFPPTKQGPLSGALRTPGHPCVKASLPGSRLTGLCG